MVARIPLEYVGVVRIHEGKPNMVKKMLCMLLGHRDDFESKWTLVDRVPMCTSKAICKRCGRVAKDLWINGEKQ